MSTSAKTGLQPEFIIAFAVGIFFCYITYPPPEYIIKHPTPENADHTIYRDDSDNCFKYQAKEVQCLSLIHI